MNFRYILAALILTGGTAVAQEPQEVKPEHTEVWGPVPAEINPGKGNAVPSDAVALFEGNNLDRWVSAKGGPAGWNVNDGVMTVKAGAGDIQTKLHFDDFQLHVEWRAPQEVKGEGQGRGNSGIFLQGLYEVQVLDSYNNRTYANGQAGSVYKQTIPLVNPTRPPGEWQTYDIIYTAPRFSEDGSVKSKARVTVLLNGVLVQNNTIIEGPTTYIGEPQYKEHGARPILLQDHGNPVSYRNIWIREL